MSGVYDCMGFRLNTRRARHEFVVNTIFGPSVEATLPVWDADERTLDYWKRHHLGKVLRSERGMDILRPFPSTHDPVTPPVGDRSEKLSRDADVPTGEQLPRDAS